MILKRVTMPVLGLLLVVALAGTAQAQNVYFLGEGSGGQLQIGNGLPLPIQVTMTNPTAVTRGWGGSATGPLMNTSPAPPLDHVRRLQVRSANALVRLDDVALGDQDLNDIARLDIFAQLGQFEFDGHDVSQIRRTYFFTTKGTKDTEIVGCVLARTDFQQHSGGACKHAPYSVFSVSPWLF